MHKHHVICRSSEYLKSVYPCRWNKLMGRKTSRHADLDPRLFENFGKISHLLRRRSARKGIKAGDAELCILVFAIGNAG